MLTGLLTQILSVLTSAQVTLGIVRLCSTAQPSESWKASDYPLAAVEQGGGTFEINRGLSSDISLADGINLNSKSNRVSIFVFTKAGHDWVTARDSATTIAAAILDLAAQSINLSDGDKTMKLGYEAGTDKINGVDVYVYRLDIEIKENF